MHDESLMEHMRSPHIDTYQYKALNHGSMECMLCRHFWFCLGACLDGIQFKANAQVSWIIFIHDLHSMKVVCTTSPSHHG